jgi:hypothetical protein
MACDRAFHARDRGRRDRKTAKADVEQGGYAAHVARHVAAQAHRDAMRVGVLDDFVDEPQHGRLQRIVQRRQIARVTAAGRHVLNQVVGADREEIRVEQVDRERRRGDLDHHAELGDRMLDSLVA